MALQKLSASAVRCGDVVYSGALRHTGIKAAMLADGLKLSGCVDGFLTESGAFVDRRLATMIVLRAQQTHLHTGRVPNLAQGDMLYSEDLW